MPYGDDGGIEVIQRYGRPRGAAGSSLLFPLVRAGGHYATDYIRRNGAGLARSAAGWAYDRARSFVSSRGSGTSAEKMRGAKRTRPRGDESVISYGHKYGPSGNPSIPRNPFTKVKPIYNFRYSQLVHLDPSTGTPSNNGLQYLTFLANGVNDPGPGSPAGAPLYWDQVKPRYEDYCVLKSKCTVEYFPTTSAQPALAPGFFGVTKWGDSTWPFTTMAQLKENRKPMVSYGPLDYKKTAYSSFDLLKDVGRGARTDGDYRVPTSNNPTATGQWYYQVYTGSVNGDAVGFYALVTIDYMIELSHPKRVASSF